jgi:GxxExxY protein
MTLSHPQTERLTHEIISAAIEVHRFLGQGLLESSYEKCLAIEFGTREITFERQPIIEVLYKGLDADITYRPDMIANGTVIIEVKAVEKVLPVHKAQLLTYMKHTKIKVGLLFNFNAETILAGMTRISL